MRKSLIMIWFLCIEITLSAQVYVTQTGNIQISGKYGDVDISAVSAQLHMQVNYDRAEINMRLVLPSLVTGNDSLNRLLRNQTDAEVHFSGKMNISYIQTKSHPRQKFLTAGTLTINGVKRPFSFNSVLEHFPAGNKSCNLTASFTINLDEFGIKTGPHENMVRIKMNQLVLKRPGE
ncbi:hypothetical protein A3860_34325 [Niastella vici]|uniref:Lipid/polyisoprenoid-binding YceI-like domain-containing protein n=1 Tax=Niastella vici TaxID=1703345 RepID=A0A1V9FP74_9BACT|nr:YceI family protein [Niastella vici]OQP60159.1 hypothetical protein A3860_34325 [Niastella vici]